MNINASTANPPSLGLFPSVHVYTTLTVHVHVVQLLFTPPFFLTSLYRQTYRYAYDAIGRLICTFAQSLSRFLSPPLSHSLLIFPRLFSFSLFSLSLFNSLCLYPTQTTYACTYTDYIMYMYVLCSCYDHLLFYVAIGRLICTFSTPFSLSLSLPSSHSPSPLCLILSLPLSLSLSLSPSLTIHVACTCKAAAIHSDDPLPFFLPQSTGKPIVMLKLVG